MYHRYETILDISCSVKVIVRRANISIIVCILRLFNELKIPAVERETDFYVVYITHSPFLIVYRYVCLFKNIK